MRDRLVAVVVERTAAMRVPRMHPLVRDWTCSTTVWGPPPSEDAVSATPWRLVSPEARAVVRAWRAEQVLEMFFRVAMRRNAAMGDQRHGAVDTQRFEFWRRYVGQVAAWRLVLNTTSLYGSEPELVKIRREEGASVARLETGDGSLDAFMLRIGPLLVVEFSRMGHASYVYPASARGVPSLKERAFYLGELKLSDMPDVHRIVHRDGWMSSAAAFLRSHGILPDGVARASRRPAGSSTSGWEMPSTRTAPIPDPGPAARQPGRLGAAAVERLQDLVDRFGGFLRRQPAGAGRSEIRYLPDSEPDAAARELLVLLGFEADDSGLYWRLRV